MQGHMRVRSSVGYLVHTCMGRKHVSSVCMELRAYMQRLGHVGTRPEHAYVGGIVGRCVWCVLQRMYDARVCRDKLRAPCLGRRVRERMHVGMSRHGQTP